MPIFQAHFQRSRELASALRHKFGFRRKTLSSSTSASAASSLSGQQVAAAPSLRSTSQRTPPASFRRSRADILLDLRDSNAPRHSFEDPTPASSAPTSPDMQLAGGKRTSDMRDSCSHIPLRRKRRMSLQPSTFDLLVPPRSTSLELPRDSVLRAKVAQPDPLLLAQAVEKALPALPREDPWQQLLAEFPNVSEASLSDYSIEGALLSESDDSERAASIPPGHDQATAQTLRTLLGLQEKGGGQAALSQQKMLQQLRRLDATAQAGLISLFEELLSPSSVDIGRMARALQNKTARQLGDLIGFLGELGGGALDASALPKIAEKWSCLSRRERVLVSPVLLEAAKHRDHDASALEQIDSGLACMLNMSAAQRPNAWKALGSLPEHRDLLPIEPLIDMWQQVASAGGRWGKLICLADAICPIAWGSEELVDIVNWLNRMESPHRQRLEVMAPSICSAIEDVSGTQMGRRHFSGWVSILEVVTSIDEGSRVAVLEEVIETLSGPQWQGRLDKCLLAVADALSSDIDIDIDSYGDSDSD